MGHPPKAIVNAGFGLCAAILRSPIGSLITRRIRPVPPADLGAVPVHADSVGDPTSEQWLSFFGGSIVHNVTHPTLLPVLPSPAQATGAAMIVLPGGGMRGLMYQSEGLDIAEWLAAQGIAAFVLKYRLRPTPREPALFLADLATTLQNLWGKGRPVPPEADATADALAAVDLLRNSAERYGHDADRVGVIGFSGGAITVLDLVRTAKPEQQPTIAAYIYGPMDRIDVPQDAPPLLVALAQDDLFYEPEPNLVTDCRKAGVAVTYHPYKKGSHGFGLGRAGTDSEHFPTHLRSWLTGHGFARA